jgi:hypothetical protein
MVMNQFNYTIIEIYDLSNIVCINSELCDILHIDKINDVNILYKNQYINNHKRFTQLPWNENVNHWLNITNPADLKNEIYNYFSYNNNRSKFAIKTKIQDVDFVLDF